MGHHFSTDLARKIPQLDATDVYAFESDRPRTTCFVLIVNPKSKRGAEDNFSPDALYKVHLGADRVQGSGVTYAVRVSSGRVELGRLEQAAGSLGTAGVTVGSGEVNAVLVLPGEIRLWVGTVKDPFFGNQSGLREFREAAEKGMFDLNAFGRHVDESPFTGMVASAIVLEIPNEFLPSQIYYFATVDWHDHDHWHRSNRVGHVLLPHLYLFSATDEQRAHRHEHLPAQDHQHHALAVATIETYSRLAGVQLDPSGYARKIADMLLPDAVPYVVGTKASYAVECVNGRALTDDAMDVALSWVVGATVDDRVTQAPGRVSTIFPFVVSVD